MQLLQTLVCMLPAFLLVQGHVIRDPRTEDKKTESKSIGGLHGTIFDDASQIGEHHRRLSAIAMSGGCEGTEIARVSQILMSFRDNHNLDDIVSVNHGKHHNHHETRGILLNLDEYVNKVEIATYKADVGPIGFSSWTRIGYIKFYTNQEKTLECGAIFGAEQKVAFSDGALLYLSGRHGEVLDLLKLHWIPDSDF